MARGRDALCRRMSRVMVACGGDGCFLVVMGVVVRLEFYVVM